MCSVTLPKIVGSVKTVSQSQSNLEAVQVATFTANAKTPIFDLISNL